eukprot:c3600_g1_i1.p1 GENE.c3600_g1_i1~~c3600_g1_i1.p1  ORF type:complete len:383 (+),score=41.47 c3600_g1_i1:169-1149(+)
MSDKIVDGGTVFNPLLMHNTSSGQFMPTHPYSSSSAKLHSLTSGMSFPHMEHHPDRDSSKLQAKPETWHSLGSGFNYCQTELVDPATVFNPVQIQTLRYLFRATIDEYLFAKNNHMMSMSPLSSCVGVGGRGIFSSTRSVTETRSDEESDDGTVTLSAAEKKLVRHTIEERWPDGNFPCPKDVKYTDLNELAHAAAVKILATKQVDNPAVLKSRIKKQINRALTNKRRHLAIKSNPDMREKVVNKMKRFRAKVKDVYKAPDQKSDGESRPHVGHASLLSMGSSANWPQTSSTLPPSSVLQVPPSHLTNHTPSFLPFVSGLPHTLSH